MMRHAFNRVLYTKVLLSVYVVIGVNTVSSGAIPDVNINTSSKIIQFSIATIT